LSDDTTPAPEAGPSLVLDDPAQNALDPIESTPKEEVALSKVLPPPPKYVPSAQPAPVLPAATVPLKNASISTQSGLDAATEYIARIKFVAPTMPNFGVLLATMRRIGKPLRAFGCRTDSTWEVLVNHPLSAYEQLEWGLQLADRKGAVLPDQLNAFTRALYDFAAEEGGAVTCPDKPGALDQARDLDQFCMEVDVLIGLNVVSADSRPFTSEAMHRLALEARLSLEPDGSFHAVDPTGHTLFTLSNQGNEPFPRDGRGLTTRGFTLLFDVPRVANGLVVFDRMTQLGFDLAARLEGRLVDDNGRIVSEESLNRDRSRLIDYYRRMELRGIPPGGERALRLFV
jgi:hypothetical protein